MTAILAAVRLKRLFVFSCCLATGFKHYPIVKSIGYQNIPGILYDFVGYHFLLPQYKMDTNDLPKDAQNGWRPTVCFS